MSKVNRKYPFPIYEEDEEALLERLLIRKHFSFLPDKQKVVLGLRLLGYTQVVISRLMNISRTSIGSLEKKAIKNLKDMIFREVKNGGSS